MYFRHKHVETGPNRSRELATSKRKERKKKEKRKRKERKNESPFEHLIYHFPNFKNKILCTSATNM